MFDSTMQEYLPELKPLQRKEKKEGVLDTKGKAQEATLLGDMQFALASSEISQIQKQQSAALKYTQDLEKSQQARQNEVVKSTKAKETKNKNEQSKNLILEMTNKISAKNVTEQLYPVSNETINRLLFELQGEIEELTSEVSRREGSLAMNSTNQHIKKELQTFEKALNQVKTIKDLYVEKIESRNKIAELQSRVIDLKGENRQLKIKIARGIEKIESHIHNLPCEREKELIKEVNRCKLELSVERQMRLNLEVNIKNIVLNFNRFYVEADKARCIVVERLRTLDSKEAMLDSKITNLHISAVDRTEEQSGAIMSRQKSRDNAVNGSQGTVMKGSEKEKVRESLITESENLSNGNATKRRKDKAKPVELERTAPTLEEQIEKMRSNQALFARTARKPC